MALNIKGIKLKGRMFASENQQPQSPLVVSTSVSEISVQKDQAITAVIPVTATGGVPPYTFSISPTLPTGLSFNTSTGQITGTPTAASVQTIYTVTVNDSDSGSGNSSFSLTVTNPLIATTDVASVIFTQGSAITPVTPVTATGGTTPYTYAISPALPTGLSFNTSTGQITGTPTATKTTTTYTVTVTDAATDTANSTFSLRVDAPLDAVTDVASVIFTQNTAITPVTPVTATGGTTPYTYAISPALPTGLSFNTSTGQITGTPTATKSSTTYTVTVTDSVSRTDNSTFSLVVASQMVVSQIITGLALTIGQAVDPNITSVANVSGGIQPYTFSISPALPAGLSFNTSTGIISGTPTEISPQTNYTVTISDSSGQTNNSTVLFIVVSSVLTTTTVVPTISAVQYTAITPVTPVTASGGRTPYTFSISPALPTGLSFNTSTGQITGTPTGTSSSATYTVEVIGALGSGPSSSTFTLSVAAAYDQYFANVAALLHFDGSNGATTGVVDSSAYNNTVTMVNGSALSTTAPKFGTASMSLTGSTQNATVAYNSAYNIGTGDFTVELWVKTTSTTGVLFDTYSTTGIQIELNAGKPRMYVGGTGYVLSSSTAITSGQWTAVAFVRSGTTYQVFINGTSAGTSTTGGTANLTSSAPIKIGTNQGNTGGFSGNIDEVRYTVGVARYTSNYTVASYPFPNQGLLAATTAVSSVILTQNTAITPVTPVTVSGGTSPYTFSISPALPTGLTLNTSTGQITGTPTVTKATTTYTVTIVDSSAGSVNSTFSLRVDAPLSVVTDVSSVSYVQNTAITPVTPVTASGGTTPYTYAISPALPTGLSFNTSTGQITGTPTATKSATTYTVTVTDSASRTNNSTFSLEVIAELVVTTAVANSYLTKNVAVSAFTPVTATGGTGSYTFAVSPALPDGLSFNTSTGQITGTPTANIALTSFTVTVTSGVQSKNSSFNLNVTDPVTATTAVPTLSFTEGTAITPVTPVTATGGTGSYTFAVSPALPGGLSFNTSTGQITGTPASPSATATYTVTVTDTQSRQGSSTFSLTVAGIPDPYWSNVQLLLHLDGANNSTTFTDVSSTPKTVTADGNAKLSTTSPKFGTASVILDGSGDAVSVAYTSALNLTGDFTIEMWVKTNTSSGVLFDMYSGGGLQIEMVSGVVKVYVNGGYRTQATTSMTGNVWKAMAVTRQGDVFRVYINGTKEGEATYAAGSLAKSVPIKIGTTQAAGGGVNGYIDEVRLTVGVARYTGSSYTVATSEFPNN